MEENQIKETLQRILESLERIEIILMIVSKIQYDASGRQEPFEQMLIRNSTETHAE